MSLHYDAWLCYRAELESSDNFEQEREAVDYRQVYSQIVIVDQLGYLPSHRGDFNRRAQAANKSVLDWSKQPWVFIILDSPRVSQNRSTFFSSSLHTNTHTHNPLPRLQLCRESYVCKFPHESLSLSRTHSLSVSPRAELSSPICKFQLSPLRAPACYLIVIINYRYVHVISFASCTTLSQNGYIYVCLIYF